MELTHGFSVPVSIDEAWEVLLDLERVAPCLPGATLESVEGDTFTGRMRVKVGPISVGYAGTAEFVERDESAHRVVIAASGVEARGSGSAKATITAQLFDDGDRGTRVTVVTDFAVTGRPAQFGRGVMSEVGDKIIARFAAALSAELTAARELSEPEPEPGSDSESAGGVPRPAPTASAAASADLDIVELLGPRLKSAAALALVTVALAALAAVRSARRRRSRDRI